MIRLLKWLLVLGTGGIVLGAILGWFLYLHFSRDLPPLNGLKDYHPSLVTRVYARDYQLIGEFYVERRQFIASREVPRDLIKAVLAIEDTSFFQHPGIDPVGILRAVVANVMAGRTVQGASTITQQVAKTFLLSSEKTLGRKLREWILSFRIEEHFTKDEILELYLNQIYLGAGAYGMGAAARIYFNRDVQDLHLGQMALLAGLPKAPSRYDPWRSPEAARGRQGLVLKRMVEAGFITEAQSATAAKEDLHLAYPQVPLEQVAPYFLEHVRRSLLAEWGNHQLYHGGLEVFTSLDPALQRAALTAVRRGLVVFDRRNGYRGALDHLEPINQKTVAEWLKNNAPPTPEPPGSKPIGPTYLKALVTGLAPDQSARMAIQGGKAGTLSLKGVEWARKQLTDGHIGPVIKKVTDVLKPGDVILVEEKEDGAWVLAQHPDAESALIALDPHTGQILAMVGGYDFNRSEFNRATQSKRQPGSSIKPFIYASALAAGFSPATLVDDAPLEIPYNEGSRSGVKIWQPQNYDHTFQGLVTMRTALEHSRNLPTIRLVMAVGVPKTVSYLGRFGLNLARPHQNLTMSLGTMDFTPMQMATAYGVFANGGKLVQPVYLARVQDRYGRTIFRHAGGDCLLCHASSRSGMTAPTTEGLPRNDGEDPDLPPPAAESQSMFLSGKQVIDAEVAYQTTSLMKGVIERGTAKAALKLNRPLAGKTGTTNDLRDAWFIGFSPSLVTAVWMGRDDFTPLGIKETGGRAALPIWMDFMAEALAGIPVTDFPIPPGIHLEAVDHENGMPADAGSKNAIWEAFKGDERPGAGSTLEEEESEGQGVVLELDEGLY